jgi:hypothetical protein
MAPRKNWSIFRSRDVLIAFVLTLATFHCVRAAFFDNAVCEFMPLNQYENGTAYNPYQYRAMWVPILHWAHSQHTLIRIANWLNVVGRPPEIFTPEKVLCALVACVCLPLCCLILTWLFLRRGGAIWWLPWLLTLEILFTSYVARSVHAIWYPYDFPNLLFISIATIFLFRQQFWPLLLLMPIATINRETVVFWAVYWLVLLWDRQPRWRTLVQSAALSIAWAIPYIFLRYRYLHNPIEHESKLSMNLHVLLGPWSWPQLFSALGYLPLLILAFWSLTSRQHRRLIAAMAVTSLPLLWKGLWIESRIFLEYLPFTVIIASEMVERSGLFSTERLKTGKRFAATQEQDHISNIA